MSLLWSRLGFFLESAMFLVQLGVREIPGYFKEIWVGEILFPLARMCSLPSLLLVSWISMVSWQSDWPVDMVDILNAFYESIFVKVQNAMFWPPMMLVAMATQPGSKEWGWVAMMICDIQQISIRMFKCLASFFCGPTKSHTTSLWGLSKNSGNPRPRFMYSCLYRSFQGYFVL